MTFLSTFQEHLEANFSFLKKGKILVAVSGGIDSMVLSTLLLELDFKFGIAHCNFQLRAAESDGDATFVENWAKKHRIPYHEKSFNTTTYAQEHKISIQMAARELRYAWFRNLLKERAYTYLLTAHHLNDQLETYLLNTIRGTGLKGLTGIPSYEVPWIRPLLPFSKTEIASYAAAASLKWREDSSNDTTDYRRNHIRHNVIPNLLATQPNALENFSNSLQILEEANDFIDLQIEMLKKQHFQRKEDSFEIATKELLALEPLKFCLHNLFSPYGFVAKEVQKLLNADSGKYLLSKTHRLIKDRQKLILEKLKIIKQQKYFINLKVPSNNLPIDLQWKQISTDTSEKRNANEALFDRQKLPLELVLRKAKKGDCFYPTGMRGKKLISKYFKDEKYNLLEKEKQWLLCSEDKIVWVVGKRCDRRFCASETTKEKILFTTNLK